MSTAYAQAIKCSNSGLAGDCFLCFIYSSLTVMLRMIIETYPLYRPEAKSIRQAHKLGISQETS